MIFQTRSNLCTGIFYLLPSLIRFIHNYEERKNSFCEKITQKLFFLRNGSTTLFDTVFHMSENFMKLASAAFYFS